MNYSEEREIKCQVYGCNEKKMITGFVRDDEWFRKDRYGIELGIYCDSDWEIQSDHYENYEFDPLDAGENLEEDL